MITYSIELESSCSHAVANREGGGGAAGKGGIRNLGGEGGGKRRKKGRSWSHLITLTHLFSQVEGGKVRGEKGEGEVISSNPGPK